MDERAALQRALQTSHRLDETTREALRSIIEDGHAGASLETVLWRLRTLYRVLTGTDPWPETRR